MSVDSTAWQVSFKPQEFFPELGAMSRTFFEEESAREVNLLRDALNRRRPEFYRDLDGVTYVDEDTFEPVITLKSGEEWADV